MSGWIAIAAVAGMVAVALGVAVWFYRRTLYGGPWFLLLGPGDADRMGLLAGARQTAVPRGARASTGTTPGLSWHYFESGAVIDVAAHLAFPDGDPDALGWERALHLLKRYRTRRPVDGIVVALPAALFTDPERLSRVHEVGAVVRDRLLQAQRYFGFALPVYVLVTGCESVRGFTAFARALPPGLLANMLGWSNPHAVHELFSGEWITEGFAHLHRTIARIQVELFAIRPDVRDDASDLLLFSRDVTRLMPPLRAFLEELFRPGLRQESFFLRGFYLSGEGAPAPGAANVLARDLTSLVTAPARPVVFVSDLFEWKIFPERGVARPLPGRVRTTRRALLAARLAVALLALVLAGGTAYAYVKARQVRNAYAALFTSGGDLLDERRQLRRDERTLRGPERLAQSRHFLEQLQRVGGERVGSLFMPASLVRSLDTRLSALVTDVFEEVVLGDVRDALRDRAVRWLGAGAAAADPSVVAGPRLEDNVFYQRLEQFAADYESIATGVRRYEQLAAGDGPPDLSGASELLGVLTGSPLESPSVPPTIGRAVQAARGEPVGCDIFDGQPGTDGPVGVRASQLLDAFGEASFGDDNPLLVAATDFSTDWSAVREGLEEPGLVLDLMDDTTHLSSAAAAWGSIGARSQTLTLPVLARPPFTRMPESDRICTGLRPDLSAAISRVAALRDRLSARLLELEVEPFGPVVLTAGNGLVLNEAIGHLKTDFDGLKGESFWAPPPMESSGMLPSNPVWRPELFDEVVKVADAYDAYRGRAFGHLAVSDRQRLLNAVRVEVARIVSARLVLTAAAGGPPSTDPQQRVEEVTSLGVQLGRAGRLVPLLAHDWVYGQDVLRALDQQALRALQDVDRLASSRYPAVFAQQYGAVFARWSDVQRAAALPEALKQWSGAVDEQREGTQQLAQLARPLVQFLAPRQPAALVRRWSAVVTDVAYYDQKRPENDLGALHAVLRDTVPSIAPEDGCRAAGVVGAPASGAGFFAGVRKEIVDEGVRRCRALVEERYRTIAAGFNRLLAGRAPFRHDAGDGPEATPAQLAEFLTIYEGHAGRTLRPALETRACSADVLSFVRGLDSIDALLGGMRTATPPVLTVDVLPEFRFISPRDVGADQIAQWQMQIGSHTFQDGVPGKPAPWKSGDPVALTLRFARDSPHRPIAAAEGGRVQERSVTYEFAGTWALLQLVRAGRGADTGAPVENPGPTVLRFEIPVARDPATPPLTAAPASSPFSASMRLQLYAPGKPDVVAIGDLPTHAPVRLSCPGT